MNAIDWNIYDEINDMIPKDTDILLTVEHKETKERKVIMSRIISHRISPSAPVHYNWIEPKRYFFDTYKIVAWAHNILPYKDNCWDSINENEFICSDCLAVWKTADISRYSYCPNCGQPKIEVRKE